MPISEQLCEFHQTLHRDAERLAGGLTDLAQRATVYHHLYEHSGRNHIFPLIAAHGALWARNYFRLAMKLGHCVAWQYPTSSEKRRTCLAQLAEFADAFRDINRRVCIDTYVSYHFTERFGDHLDADQFVPTRQLLALNRCHAARRRGEEFSNDEKRDVFQTFFLNEQETVVGPSVLGATEKLDWPLMKNLALRPIVRFAYFPRRRPFFFRNFADQDERIEKGLLAFDVAAAVGWDYVESSLKNYKVLPDAFFAGSCQHFENVRETILVPNAGC